MEYFQDIKGLSTEELEQLLKYESEQLEASLGRLGETGLKEPEESRLKTEADSYQTFINVIVRELDVRKNSQSVVKK
jgi:hypothetical protein